MPARKKLSASLEDYLEAIFLIIQREGEARSKEIMKQLGVSGPSVTEALQLLARKKMVNYQPYEAITLTEAGEKIARDVLHRHETLREFFVKVLGIDHATADRGACLMEHAASPNIIDRMVKYMQYLKTECRQCGATKEGCFAHFLQELNKNESVNQAGEKRK